MSITHRAPQSSRTLTTRTLLLGVALAAGGGSGCGRSPTSPSLASRSSAEAPTPVATLAGSAPNAHAGARPTAQASAAASAAAPVDWSRAPYPWLAEPGDAPAPVDPLSGRFAPPAGFERVPLPDGSFGAWLRGLPLAAAGTPVRTFRGDVLREASHPNIAGVAALDVGKGDLQQCADSIMRLHAEWRWSRGDRAVSYRAASGAELPFARWSRGERVVAHGNALAWELTGKPGADHANFRKYLDTVFNWANTVALARDAARTSLEQLRPGDFFILPGNPGHTVLVLDLARAPDGRRAVLLGQGFMPAQSFHILKSSPGEAWFAIDHAKEGVATPFWEPFPWSSLRRLDGASLSGRGGCAPICLFYRQEGDRGPADRSPFRACSRRPPTSPRPTGQPSALATGCATTRASRRAACSAAARSMTSRRAG